MAKILVLEGPMKGVQLEIDKEVVFVGRSAANDIRIGDETVSRKHLKIFSVESCYFIEDLKSKNGTMVNGEPLDAGFGRLITENDRIQLGLTLIHLDGIGVNKPPITVEEIEAHPLEKVHGPGSSRAYLGEERRSRVFEETTFIYDLLQFMVGRPNLNQLLEKVAESLFESYPRIDRVSAFLFDDEKNRMEHVVSRSKEVNDKEPSSYTKAILDQVVRDGKIVTIYLKADAMRNGFTNAQDTVALTAVICLPVMNGEKVRGAINIEGFRESNPVRQEDFLLMKTIKCLLELGLQIADQSNENAQHSENRSRA
jgi:hypothetical protein